MKYRLLLISLGLLVVTAGTSHADLFHSPKFKSPAGKHEVIFASPGDAGVPFAQTIGHLPAGHKLQYILLFYVAGGSDPVSADWYSDISPAPPAADIAASFLWSPDEEHVVITHGQAAKSAGANRWLVSLSTWSSYGFEGDHLRWVDNTRLVGDLQSKKVPGGIILETTRGHAELLISPKAGLGYMIAASTGPRVTVKDYLNHWGDERDKTSWELFESSCFDLNLDTLKKRTVPCPH